eukprot:15362181-Ditylum_brightwellii.AAC.1
MAHGEELNSDCGGGSLVSNAHLVFYQLLMADMFEKDAQVDAPKTAQHAQSLSAAFLAATAAQWPSSRRGIADSSIMANLT